MSRVLFVVGQLGGGGSERQLALLLEQPGTGIDAHGFLLNGGGRWQERVRERCGTFHVCRHRIPLLRGMEFLGVLKRVRPDVVHSWTTYPAAYALLTRPLHRRPVIVNVRADLTRDGETGAPVRNWLRSCLRHADAVVANSQHGLDALGSEGLRFRKQMVIANGVEVLDVPERDPRGREFRVLGLGSLKPLKNWAQAVRVCGDLRRRGWPLRLTILGEGPERSELERRCREWSLEPQATFPGFVDDIAAHLRDADLLIHPSRSEGMPNAILEALGAGLPVLASDISASRELAAHGEILRLFPVGDDEACSGALVALLENPDLCRTLGVNGRRFVLEHHGCRRMARCYAALYQEILTGH